MKHMAMFLGGVWAWGVLAGVPAGAEVAKSEASPANPPPVWQYHAEIESSRVDLWVPPKVETLRGLLVGDAVGIASDPEVRRVCAEAGIGIVRGIRLGTFIYWKEGSKEGPHLLAVLDALATQTGHPELRRVPWITVGHSTGGITCRNIAYWNPDRVAGVIHIKSGNFHQKSAMPPDGTLAGVPLVAINGQLETYGPAVIERPMKQASSNGVPLDERYGRETQWIYVRKDIEQFRAKDPNHLMSTWVHHGDDHFMGAPELSQYAALFIRKTAQYRIPSALPPGSEPVKCLPLKAEDGWLTDSDFYNLQYAPAPYNEYKGDKSKAMWQYDREIAEANAAWHRKLGHHQILDNPKGQWLDEGDGWTFKVTGNWLTEWPEKYGGERVGKPVGHANTPFVFRIQDGLPVAQIGPDTFRLVRSFVSKNPTVSFAAFHPGDDQYRTTIRWGSLPVPAVKGDKQTIEFPAVPDLKADAGPYELQAKASSGLPVYYDVDFGPAMIRDRKVVIVEVPVNAPFPLECRVTAYQVGRRVAPALESAPPVSRTFKIVKP